VGFSSQLPDRELFVILMANSVCRLLGARVTCGPESGYTTPQQD